MKVCFGVNRNAVILIAIVTAVTSPGVNGSGNEMYAVTQQNATQIAIIVNSRVFKLEFKIGSTPQKFFMILDLDRVNVNLEKHG